MKPNLIALLDQLEETVSEATRIPMTDKVVIDMEVFLDLLEQIRYVLPDELVRAKQIENDREKLMSTGQKDADKIIRQAEEYARKLLDEHEIAANAKAQAKQVIQEAEARAKEFTKDADEYADRTLRELADTLRRTLAVIDKGRQKLRHG